MSEPVEKPFSPALIAIIAQFIAEADHKVRHTLDREAAFLGYPEGTEFDVEKRVWRLPG